MNIIESPPLLVGVFKRILKHFSGIGVDLIQQMNGNEALYLYDKSGFRTLVGTMFHRLIEKHVIKFMNMIFILLLIKRIKLAFISVIGKLWKMKFQSTIQQKCRLISISKI